MKNPIEFFFGKEAPEGSVPNRELLSLSGGLTGQNMTYGYVANWLFYFMEKILHIKPFTVGSINGIMRIWDSINDPIFGAVIDRHRFKSGEKLRPYHSVYAADYRRYVRADVYQLWVSRKHDHRFYYGHVFALGNGL